MKINFRIWVFFICSLWPRRKRIFIDYGKKIYSFVLYSSLKFDDIVWGSRKSLKHSIKCYIQTFPRLSHLHLHLQGGSKQFSALPKEYILMGHRETILKSCKKFKRVLYIKSRVPLNFRKIHSGFEVLSLFFSIILFTPYLLNGNNTMLLLLTERRQRVV